MDRTERNASPRFLPGLSAQCWSLPTSFRLVTRVFGSERLTGALLDRLTHHVLEMNGDSYRLKHSRQNAAPQTSEDPEDS